MQGPIAQILALTVTANAAIAGHDTSGFWPGASVFSFTKTCNFVTQAGAALYPDPEAWLAGIKAHCSGARLRAFARNHPMASDRMLVGFVGGGPRWILETVGAKGTRYWEGHDAIGDRRDPQRKIWKTTYVNITESFPKAAPDRSLREIATEMRSVLTAIAAFAHENGAENFEHNFRTALEALNGVTPLAGAYHADIARFGHLTPEASNLFGAVQRAWVFGGMGSWNDMSFDGEAGKHYEELSARLFTALNDTISAVANATFPA